MIGPNDPTRLTPGLSGAVLPSDTLPRGTRFGRYEITRFLSQGGMGAVYEARDTAVGRRVALKVMLAGDEDSLARFQREVHAAAQLVHPNIVQVHDVGVENGRHYYTMNYVEGPTLAQVITDMKRLPPRAAARIARDVARALDAAHSRGIIHRDIKPSNILLSAESSDYAAPRAERPGIRNQEPGQTDTSIRLGAGFSEHYHVMLADFGLAKEVEASRRLTITGALLGTPLYMSPEQAMGDAVDVRSDVYSLAAVLYEMLGGGVPFVAENLGALLQKIVHDDPTPLPAVLNPDLRTIAAKGMTKEKSRRYATARDFAEDLDRFLNGEAIAARPASFWYRMRKRAARHRALTAGIGVAACAFFAVIAYFGGPAWIEIETRPAGATINVDGCPETQTASEGAATVMFWPCWRRTISIGLEGYEWWQRDASPRPWETLLTGPNNLRPEAGMLTWDIGPATATIHITSVSLDDIFLAMGTRPPAAVGAEPVRPDPSTRGAPRAPLAQGDRDPGPQAEDRVEGQIAAPLYEPPSGPVRPVRNMSVAAGGTVDCTLPPGRHRIALPNGAYTMEITAPGHLPQRSLAFQIDPDRAAVLPPIRLEHEYGYLTVEAQTEGMTMLVFPATEEEFVAAAQAGKPAPPVRAGTDRSSPKELTPQPDAPHESTGAGTATEVGTRPPPESRIAWQFSNRVFGPSSPLPADGDRGAPAPTGLPPNPKSTKPRPVWLHEFDPARALFHLSVPIERYKIDTGIFRLVFTRENHFPRERFVRIEAATTVGHDPMKACEAHLRSRGVEIVSITPDRTGFAIQNRAGRRWTMFPAEKGHTHITERVNGQVMWSFPTEGETQTRPALGDLDGDGWLDVVVGANDSNIYARSGRDGSPLWEFKTGRRVWSSPALGDLDGDSLLDVIVGSDDSNVYALSGRDGAPIWEFKAENTVASSPALGDLNGDGVLDVVIGAGDSRVYALSGRDGTPLWSFLTGSSIVSSPALGDLNGDSVLDAVVGSEDSKVYALSGRDGTLLWDFKTGGQVWSSPALGDLDGDRVLDAVVGSYDRTVYALSGRDGKPLWKFQAAGRVSSSPALGDLNGDTVPDAVVGSDDSKLYALSGRDGSLLWEFLAENWVSSSPALGDLDGDSVVDAVVGSWDSRVYALSGRDGKPLWNVRLGSQVRASPVLGDLDGDARLDVVIGSDDFKVCALSGRDGSPHWEIKTGSWISSSPALGDLDGDTVLDTVVGSGDTKVYAVSGRDGTPLWEFRTGRSVDSSPALGDLDGDAIPDAVVGSSDKRVYALSGRDGAPIWVFLTGNWVVSSPALGDLNGDSVPDVIVGSDDAGVHALSGRDGKPIWKSVLGGAIWSSPALGDLNGDSVLDVVVGSNDSRVHALSGRDGKPLWEYKTGNRVRSSPVLGDLDNDSILDVVVGSEDTKLYALSGRDGKPLWEFKTGGAIYASPALGDFDGDSRLDVIVGSDDSKVYALSGRDGKPLWEFRALGAVMSSAALGDLTGDSVLEAVVGSAGARVYVLSGRDGTPLSEFMTGSAVRFSPALADLDGDSIFEAVVGLDDWRVRVIPASVDRGVQDPLAFARRIAAHDNWTGVLLHAARGDPRMAVLRTQAHLALAAQAGKPVSPEAEESLRRAAAALPGSMEVRLLLAVVANDSVALLQALALDPIRVYDCVQDLDLGSAVRPLAEQTVKRGEGRGESEKQKQLTPGDEGGVGAGTDRSSPGEPVSRDEKTQSPADSGTATEVGTRPGGERGTETTTRSDERTTNGPLARAVALLLAERWGEARAAFDPLIATGLTPELLRLRGRACFGGGDPEGAVANWSALERVGGRLIREKALIAEARAARADLVGWHSERAAAAVEARRWDEAFAEFEKAVEARGADGRRLYVSPLVLNNYAWWLATYTWPSDSEPGEPSLETAPPAAGPARDCGSARSRRAVELATQAVETAPDAKTRGLYHDTLAAALYMNGEFDRAVATAELALTEAEESWHAEMKVRLEAYRKRAAGK